MSLFENPTQAIGIFAFLAAFLSCLMAGRFTKRGMWFCLAVVFLVLIFEMMLGWRHSARMKVNAVMQSMDLYDDRALMQWALVGILLLFLLAGFLAYRIAKDKIDWPFKNHVVAGWATVALVLLFVTEVISFHQVDALLYHELSGVMAIAWIWAVLAAAVVAIAFLNILYPSVSEEEDD